MHIQCNQNSLLSSLKGFFRRTGSALVRWGEAMDFDVNEYSFNRIEKLEQRIMLLEAMLKNNQKKSEKDI